MPELAGDVRPVKYRLPGLLGLTKGATPEETANKAKLRSVLTDIIDPALVDRVLSDPQKQARRGVQDRHLALLDETGHQQARVGQVPR